MSLFDQLSPFDQETVRTLSVQEGLPLGHERVVRLMKDLLYGVGQEGPEEPPKGTAQADPQGQEEQDRQTILKELQKLRQEREQNKKTKREFAQEQLEELQKLDKRAQQQRNKEMRQDGESKKWWLLKVVTLCPSCGHTIVTEEKREGERPEDPMQTLDYRQTTCKMCERVQPTSNTKMMWTAFS